MNSFEVLGLLSVLFLSVSAFRIQTAKAVNGTICIMADGSIDPPTASISTADNVTYVLTGSVTSDTDGIVIERNNTIVDGNGYTLQGGETSSGFGLEADNVTVRNTCIQKFRFGIDCIGNGCTIINNTISYNVKVGVFLLGSGNGVTNNRIGNTGLNLEGYDTAGVYLAQDSNSNTIADNQIGRNGDVGTGILLHSASDNTIVGNCVANNDYASIMLELSSNNNCIFGNNVTENYDGIRLEGSNNSVIRNNLASNYLGIMLMFESSNNSVIDNDVTNNNDTGILLSYSSDNIVVGNNVTNSGYGIRIEYSSNNSIVGNHVTNNSVQGIYLYSSSDNSISGNNITTNNIGIGVASSSNNRFSGNDISSNSYVGIRLDYSDSSNNEVSSNIVSKNDYGMFLASSAHHNTLWLNNVADNNHGIYLSGTQNNVLFHNYLVHNTQQVVSYDSANMWDSDYPSGGNYWSNYDGTDANLDGVGDTPYLIDVNNTDNYPLMGMFSDFNVTPKSNVQTICNSTISNFQSNSTAISFNVSGESGTIGFCRICIPTALMNATYKVFINGTEMPYSLLPCSNDTHSYLYFNYTHSTQIVVIIPEFSSFLVLALFMIATPFTVIVYKRKHSA